MAKENHLTMEQIAEALGLSKTTVSRALSGKGRISAKTREQVRQYVARSGCQVRSRSDQLPPETHNVALVIPHQFVKLDLPFLRKSMGGICRMAAQRNYDVLLCYADEFQTEQLERQLADRKIDGVILSRALKNDACLRLVQNARIPYVVLGHLEDPAVLQVDHDQTMSSAEMTRLLLRQGMERIAYFGGNLNNSVNQDRLRGYRMALEEAGLGLNRDLVYFGAERDERRMDALDAILEQDPACILCCDDTMAMLLLKDLQQRGIRVPEQLRLASLYDSEVLQATMPSISAVHFDSTSLGAMACRLLLDCLAGKEVQSQQVHGYQVILRDSTK